MVGCAVGLLTLKLLGVEGCNLTILGTVTLPIRLTKSWPSFRADFYVVQRFSIHWDGLLGFDSLTTHGIDVHRATVLFI